jgi:F-type H+-transporting ATPase subunit alpha
VQPTILTDIATKKALADDIKGRLTAAINDYKGNFLADRKAKKETAAKETVAAK